MATKSYLIVGGATGITQESTVDSSAGAGDSGKIPSLDTSGKISTTMMPTGFGSDTLTVTAGETLTAGNLIYISAAGTAFKADANAAGKAAIGFVLAGITSGASGTAYFGSGLITGLTSLTMQQTYFLSGTAGAVTLTAPTGTAKIQQPVGYAVSATTLYFEPQTAILLI
jgi:hypothetical protein